MIKPILFISDLHLQPQQPQIVELFLAFLRQQAAQAQALYILGDFFETWIGDDDQTPFQQQIQSALKTLTQTVPVYMIHGNRDFLLGQRFMQQTGCRLLSDPTKIQLFDVPTLLMHGDTLCTADIKYQKFRHWVRKPWLQKLFLMLPLQQRRKIAERMRQGSRQHVNRVTDDIMDVTATEVERVMVQHQVQQLIHGHTHRPALHSMRLNGQPCQRIVLGAWHQKGSVLICLPQQPPDLKEFTSLPF